MQENKVEKNQGHSNAIYYMIGLVVIIVCVECLSQYFLKNYGQEQRKMYWFMFGVILYAVIAYILVLTFKYEKMAIVNILWGGISAMLLTAMAYLVFDEKLSAREIIGIFVIFGGIVLINWK